MIMHNIVHCIDCVFLLYCWYLSPLSRRCFDDVIDDTDEELYYLESVRQAKPPCSFRYNPILSLLLSSTALGQSIQLLHAAVVDPLFLYMTCHCHSK